jgi:hypothetical protein
MHITKISWSLAVYLALIEGIALFLMQKSFHAFFIGFVPAFVVLALYKLINKQFPIKLNNVKISKLTIITLSLLNGLFMILLFLIQDILVRIFNHMFSAVFGFLSVFLVIFLMIIIYNEIPYKISFKLNNEKLKLHKIDIVVAVYAGIFEFFILPLIYVFYYLNVNVFINGFLAGLIGGLVSLFVINLIIKKYPLKIQ